MTLKVPKIAVIGGGAAGLMAAGRAAELGAAVTLFEKNKDPGKKLAITGKGRCNLTNNCDRDTFLQNVLSNPRFLYTAYSNFSAQDVMSFFEENGVPLKTERGNRVFPVSDRAKDIVHALDAYACGPEWNPVQRHFGTAVTELITQEGHVVGVQCARDSFLPFDAVIVCTGGLSYPLTGSTGDGYRFAQHVGHTLVPPRPSLVPIETEESWCRDLQGLSLRNVKVTLFDTTASRVLFDDFGEMLFTHFGISGPTILSLSSHLHPENGHRYQIRIDLKPALEEATLDRRLLADFQKYQNRNFSNALHDLLPQKLIPVIISLSGISPDAKVNGITKEERRKLLSLLKGLPLTFLRFRPIREAIVTAGGVSVSEINPKSMESRLVSGLYFAGEVLDLDAYTGGFNLQIAFSCARLAAEKAAENA